jgi:hypothetical protein
LFPEQRVYGHWGRVYVFLRDITGRLHLSIGGFSRWLKKNMSAIIIVFLLALFLLLKFYILPKFGIST